MITKRSSTTFVGRACCKSVSLLVFDGKILCTCPNHPPTVIEPDGKSYTLEPSQKVFIVKEKAE
jgi:hypothetical protein